MLAGCADKRETEPDEAPEGGLVAKPMRYMFNMPAAQNIPNDVRFTEHSLDYKTGCFVKYLVEGDDFIGFADNSLEIKSIVTEKGVEIPTTGEDAHVWKHSRLDNRLAKDGKSASFTIFTATENPMTVPKIKGSIVMMTATATTTETLVFATSDKGEKHAQSAGPLTVYINPHYFSVCVGGAYELVREVKIKSDGKHIEQLGGGWNNTTKTFGVRSDPTTAEIEVEITYYTDVVNKTVHMTQ